MGCTLLPVSQTPPVLVTFSGTVVTLSCEVRIKEGDREDLSSTLHRAGRPNVTISSRTDPARNTTLNFNVTVTERDTYYCRVTCGASRMNGTGTYIHVRDSGYVAPSGSSYRLCSGLIALCVLLLIPAASGTYLVRPFWKTEVQPPAETPAVMESSPQAVEDAGGSLYASLEPRSEEVYNILEDERKTKGPGGPKNHQVEIHDVASRSPMRKPERQVKENPPVHPKPKKNVSENNLYENF
ncbi:NFAT activation molecule 1 isoform X2 [Hyla sarda]|uniref:NFAT activation molecule 1 isoform X2 n=1 Tax=Hyla sarda TaxID=327740 RepID=UPI0024C336BB|nr:NFAT activation molecule 1 isoform X2 [Hyla sarda]